MTVRTAICSSDEETDVRRLLVLAPHPVHYHAPVYRSIDAHPLIDLHVAFMSTVGVDARIDPSYGASMDWGEQILAGYSHSFVKNLLPGETSPMSLRLNPGVVRLLRDFNPAAVLVHGHLSPTNWLAVLHERVCRRRTKIFYRGEGTRSRASTAGKVSDLVCRGFFTFVDGLVVTDDANRTYMEARARSPKPCAAVPPIIDSDIFRPGEARPWGRPVRLLSVGRFVDRKNLGSVVRAVAELERRGVDVVCDLIGDGPKRSALEELATEFSVDGRVVFRGFLSQQELSNFYREADLFVLPSRSDPSPKALSEAVASGTPSIVTASVGNATTLVEDGVTGRVITSDDETAIADAVVDLLGQDRSALQERAVARYRTIASVAFADDLYRLLTNPA